VKAIPWDRSKESLFDYRAKILKAAPEAFLTFVASRQLLQYSKFIEGTNIPLIIHEGSNPDRICGVNWAHFDMPHEVAFWERELLASGAVRIRLTMPDYLKSFPEYIRKQVRVFPNAVKPAQTLADPSGANSSRKTIINIGGMKKNKNLLPLLHAFSGLVSEFPDWDIKVFSFMPPKATEYQKNIYEFIETNGLQNRVFLLGETSEIYKEYAKSQIHAITSLSEGCPTCVCEAMVHRLPSIGLAVCPGVNKFIKNEKNGFLVTSQDLKNSLREHLRLLMENSELRVKMGEEAYKDSIEFEPAATYDKWERLFQEAVEYRNDSKRLFKEQMNVDIELAMHARRNRERIIREYNPQTPPGYHGHRIQIKTKQSLKDKSEKKNLYGYAPRKTNSFPLLFKYLKIYKKMATYDWEEE
jgi:glycosyltransferase involved in cell wall biosynthesis